MFVLHAVGELTGLERKPMPDGRIVGGFRVDITQVPWQASLQVDGLHKCGASIIGQNWLLTAAHCVAYVNFKCHLLLGSNAIHFTDLRDGIPFVLVVLKNLEAVLFTE